MLVIRRRPGETILIGDNIEVEVLEASASQVRLGIRAPRAVAVLRKEIAQVGNQNRMAARGLAPERVERVLRILKQPLAPPISRV